LASRAVSVLERSEYDAEVNNRLASALQEANSRDTSALGMHLETIQGALEGLLQETIQLRYGGSVRRHTYVDGVSDADMLVILRSETALDSSPHELISGFVEALQTRLPNTEVSAGNLSAKVKFSDGIEIQLLPAFKTRDGLRIARARGETWSGVIRPDEFAREITRQNQGLSGNLVRAIKLYKIAQSSVPEDDQLTGYHVESIAIDAFRNYTGPMQHKDVFLHLARAARDAVLRPMPERTGQSAYVDSDLGPEGSPERVRISNRIRRMVSRLESANSSADLEAWDQQFGPW
jgi:hypothetical protein